MDVLGCWDLEFLVLSWGWEIIRHTHHLLEGDDDTMMILTYNSIFYKGSGVSMVPFDRIGTSELRIPLLCMRRQETVFPVLNPAFVVFCLII